MLDYELIKPFDDIARGNVIEDTVTHLTAHSGSQQGSMDSMAGDIAYGNVATLFTGNTYLAVVASDLIDR